ncbi:MAG: hypothetical protein RIB15_02275 [Gracilimonas sp.]|uniref:hypothetical protein n=1 Tax=Gracilimonas sp. TaxID=1974203 RepID=UPI0032EF600B
MLRRYAPQTYIQKPELLAMTGFNQQVIPRRMPGILLLDKNIAVDLYPEPIQGDSSLRIRCVQNDSGTYYLSYAAIAAMSFIKKPL